MTLIAEISREALRTNLGGAEAGAVVDVRVDAWGHGAAEVAGIVLADGVGRVLADDGDRRRLLAAGIGPERLAPSGTATLDPHRLFGLAPGSAPVMRVSGAVISTKDLLRGEGVSYGYRYRAPHDTRVALVSGGYAQGIVRALGGAARVSIGDVPCPILGRVAMDVCVIDIGDAPVRRGDRAWFFGDPAEGQPALGEWTSATGFDAAELVTAVGLHAERVVV